METVRYTISRATGNATGIKFPGWCRLDEQGREDGPEYSALGSVARAMTRGTHLRHGARIWDRTADGTITCQTFLISATTGEPMVNGTVSFRLTPPDPRLRP